MASSAKHFALFFLLAFLSSSKLTQARQSEFFSKVSTAAAATTTVTPSVAKDTSNNGIEDQPNFIQDSQTGYGLYDHGNGQLPPDSDTTKTLNSSPYTTTHDVQPNKETNERLSGTSLMNQGYSTTYNDKTYVTNPEGYTNSNNNNNNEYVTKPEEYGASNNNYNNEYVTKPEEYGASNNNNNYYYNNNNEYVNEQQGFSGTSLMDRRSPTAYNQEYMSKPNGYDSTNNNYNYNNGGVNTYNSQQQQQQQQGFGEGKYLGEFNNNKNTNYYNRVNDNNNAAYNGQRQGMSDTRFMENGKYYYDVKSEYNYNPNGLDQYSNNGYSGSNINGNSMEGYQNQESELDGFNP